MDVSCDCPAVFLCSDDPGKANPPSRKRLTYPDDTPSQLPEKDSEEKDAPTAQVNSGSLIVAETSVETEKDATPDKKRSRGDQALAQESG